MTLKTSPTALLRLFRFSSVGSIILTVAVLSNCGIYSFKGSTTPANNISIQEFYNNTDLGPANLAQTFTNQLKDYMIQNTNLSVVRENGELQMDGLITDFKLTPIAPTQTDNARPGLSSASSTRLTISVKVTYVNTLDESMSFKDKTFSFYKDFNSDISLSDIEDSFIRQIFDQIVLDIFNASVANW
jgi:hypothetical protein